MFRAECLQCDSLCQVLMMDSGEHIRQSGKARCVRAHAMPLHCVHVWLVEHCPVFDAIAKPSCHNAAIVSEFLHDIPIEPAALILQSLRQIPMVKAQPRCYSAAISPSTRRS